MKPEIENNRFKNIYEIITSAKKALVSNGQKDIAYEMEKRAYNKKTYDEVLDVIREYVNVI